MNRYLFRVTYTDTDGLAANESVCVRGLTEAEARVEVEGATDRYRLATGTVRTLTLVVTAAEV